MHSISLSHTLSHAAQPTTQCTLNFKSIWMTSLKLYEYWMQYDTKANAFPHHNNIACVRAFSFFFLLLIHSFMDHKILVSIAHFHEVKYVNRKIWNNKSEKIFRKHFTRWEGDRVNFHSNWIDLDSFVESVYWACLIHTHKMWKSSLQIQFMHFKDSLKEKKLGLFLFSWRNADNSLEMKHLTKSAHTFF